MSRLKETLSKLAKEYQERIQRSIQDEDLTATGSLKKSIRVEEQEDGFSILSDEKYANLLGNFGYLKTWGKPSPYNLAQWAKTKGMRPMLRDKRGRFRKITEKSYLSLGFALAKSIDKKGTIKRYGYKGSRIIYNVNKEMEGKVSGEITEAFKLDLVNGMKQDFKFDNLKIE
jgi:hypothetical protein